MKTLKKRWKSCLCLLLALWFAASGCFGAAAMNGAYPGGVSEQAASQTALRTDTLISNAVRSFTGKTLSQKLYTALFADETLTQILLGVYERTDDSAAALSAMGLDCSPAAVARSLSGFGQIAARLKQADSWDDADLSGARWGVSSKAGFAAAVSAMFTPFNDLLYALLCGGSTRLGLLPVRGDHGYANGMIPILRALGCSQIPSASSFEADAKADRGSMLKSLAYSLFSLADALCAASVKKLCSLLPGLAQFIRDGSLERAVDDLLRPLSIHIGSSIELLSGSRLLSVLLFLQSPGKYTMDFTENVTKSINEMLESAGLTVAEIDLDALAACKGAPTDCFMVLMRWLIASLRLNQSALADLLPAELRAAADGLFRHSDEGLLALYVELMTAKEGTATDPEPQSFPFERGETEFTAKLSRKNMKKVVSELDGVLDLFIAESGAAKDLPTFLRQTIYSSSTLTALVKALYGALSGEETAALGSVLSLPGSPAALAGVLPSGYAAAKRALYRASSWEKLENVNWGFAVGSRSGFEAALTAALRPLRPILEAFLANGVLEVFGALRIGGTNGYNTAVIPLLEALSCPQGSIKTYDEYIRGKGSNRILTDLLDPVLDLLDQIMKRPVFRLTKLLPNVIFFFESGAFGACLENLLAPVTALTKQLSLSADSLGLDLDALSSIDLSDLSAFASGDLPMPLDSIDLSALSALGKKTVVSSKRTFEGKATETDYIKADQPAVLLTLLRAVVGEIKKPENASMLQGFVEQSGGGNEMFAQYSASISKQMEEMTTDELLEWLYQLLFRERAKKEIPQDDGYETDFKYEPQKSHALLIVLLSFGVLLLLAAGIALILRRKELAAYLARRKAKPEQIEPKEVA